MCIVAKSESDGASTQAKTSENVLDGDRSVTIGENLHPSKPIVTKHSNHSEYSDRPNVLHRVHVVPVFCITLLVSVQK